MGACLQWRYALLCLAALEAPLHVTLGGSTYGQECIFVANDWHASLVPVYLAAKFRAGGTFLGARSVLAIHNLRHQVCPPHLLKPSAPVLPSPAKLSVF